MKLSCERPPSYRGSASFLRSRAHQALLGPFGHSIGHGQQRDRCSEWLTDDPLQEPGNPSSQHVRRVLARYSIFARSAVRFYFTLYHVYEMFRVSPYRVWKYGIARQLVWFARPLSQKSACERRYQGSKCWFVSLLSVHGWYQARFAEAALMLAYALRHGRCPDGAPSCI